MRQVTVHKGFNQINDLIRVEPGAEPEKPGQAANKYNFFISFGDHPQKVCEIKFHSGPLENGAPPNGITAEAVLACLIDRFREFQKGPLTCRENAIVLTKLEECVLWLGQRARDRRERGVEGTNKS